MTKKYLLIALLAITGLVNNINAMNEQPSMWQRARIWLTTPKRDYIAEHTAKLRKEALEDQEEKTRMTLQMEDARNEWKNAKNFGEKLAAGWYIHEVNKEYQSAKSCRRYSKRRYKDAKAAERAWRNVPYDPYAFPEYPLSR